MKDNYRKKIKEYFSDKGFVLSFLASTVFLGASLFVNYFASYYANEKASSSVTDLVLSNIPTYNISSLFIYGTLVMFFLIILACFMDPKKIPFTLKGIAVFYLIRSVFITLTHIAPFPTQIAIDPESIVSRISFGSDLFFSGHTGLPFLLALIWWKEPIFRFIFLSFSVFFAVVVLLGHMHYSIDVLGAFFITYTIFHILEKLFIKDRIVFYGHKLISGLND